MNFVEFHRRANAISIERHGIPIEQRKLRDWVAHYELRAGREGSHTWTHTDLNRVLDISKLRSRGINSEDETLIHLWLNEIPVRLEKLREALSNEIRRLRWKLVDPINSTYDARSDPVPTLRNANAIVRKAGNASPEILPDGFKWSDGAIVGGYSLLRYGADANQPANIFSALIDFETLNKALRFGDVPAIDPNFFFAGIVGDCEEIGDSAEYSISKADAAHFVLARKMVREMRFATALPAELTGVLPPLVRPLFDNLVRPAQRVSEVFSQPDWGALMAVACVHYHFRRGRSGRP